MKVCQVSCRMNIDDTRQSRIRDAIGASGSLVVPIMTTARSQGDQAGQYGSSCVILPGTPDIFYKPNFFHLAYALSRRTANLVRAFAAVVRARPNVVHCIEPDSWLIGLIAKCLYGSALIIDFEEMYEERGRSLPGLMGKALKRLLLRWEEFAFRYADAVIHVSENRKSAYKAMATKRTLVVSHYANLSDFELTPQLRPQELKGKFVILHAGALRGEYASHELLRALEQAEARIPNLICVALGGLVPDDSACIELANQLKERGKLILKPQIPFEQVIQYMKMADVGLSLVLPRNRNLQLAFPRKFFEYLAAGLPVIASDVPDIRDAVERGECGLLVDAREPDQIASAIIQFAQRPQLRAMMAGNAAVISRALFNWRAEAEKLTSLYIELKLSCAEQSVL